MRCLLYRSNCQLQETIKLIVNLEIWANPRGKVFQFNFAAQLFNLPP